MTNVGSVYHFIATIERVINVNITLCNVTWTEIKYLYSDGLMDVSSSFSFTADGWEYLCAILNKL